MKITCIGAGSHRYASITRGLLGTTDLSIREIALYDINKSRAKLMAEFVKQTPEYRQNPCHISWDQSLDAALEGADMVNVLIMVNKALTLNLMKQAAGRHGFMPNEWTISPAGSIRGIKVCRIILDIARKMEKLCPNAWLLDFSNPVAVVSAAINHHTKIKGYGVCAGWVNHLWDISRLFGKDEMADNADTTIHCAGVNHFSFIAPESVWKGRNLYEQLDELLTAGPWEPPDMSNWNEGARESQLHGLRQLLLGYKRHGRFLFSNEVDGTAALNINGIAELFAQRELTRSYQDAVDMAKEDAQKRQGKNRKFEDFVSGNPSEKDWDNFEQKNSYLKKNDKDLMVLLAKAKAGQEVNVVTSVPNRGAIKNIPDNFVVEFSQTFKNGQMQASMAHVLPDNLFSWVAAFAAHQTMLADAIALDCPKTLYRALSCYPVNRDSKAFWAMWRELIDIAVDETTPNLAKTVDYMPK